MRRFTRLTNAFSKKFESHCHMVALYTVWYNFIRKHKTIKTTPAVAAGLADAPRGFEFIVELIEARAWPLPRKGGGGALLYSNYRVQYWRPFLKKLGLPAVTPHSARHSYISTLQAGGLEVALVAKIAGHANPATTLGIYTQAVRRSDAAVGALEKTFL